MKIEVDGQFHRFCEGCQYVSLIRQDACWIPVGGGKMEFISYPLTCKHYSLCERLLEELAKRIEGSVVTEELED